MDVIVFKASIFWKEKPPLNSGAVTHHDILCPTFCLSLRDCPCSRCPLKVFESRYTLSGFCRRSVNMEAAPLLPFMELKMFLHIFLQIFFVH
jgi:hypothetical protein